jgi:hypothetical protein
MATFVISYVTNVPSPTLGTTGLVVPDEASILSGVVADMQAAYGGSLNLNPGISSTLSTAQGQLATSLTAIIASKDSMMAQYVSQLDPKYSQGRMQDAIGYLYYLTRLPAISTQVSCTCSGAVGTVIPIGSQVQDTAGNIYSCIVGGTIGSGGNVTLTFANVVAGPIVCAPGSVNTVYITIPGWDSVTNASAGITGQNVESSIAFEARREACIPLNSIGQASAIRAAILNTGQDLTPMQVPLDARVVENYSAFTQIIGGITVQPSSVFICVAGGNATEIAAAICSKKDVGCNYTDAAYFTASLTALSTTMTVSAMTYGANSGYIAAGQQINSPSGSTIAGGPYTIVQQLGGTPGGIGTYQVAASGISTGPGFSSQALSSAVVVQVPDTGYAMPYPIYQVDCAQAVDTPINVQVTLATATNPPSTAQTTLQNGLGDAFTGADGLAAATIGGTFYNSRLYALVSALLPGVGVLGVLVGSGTPSNVYQTLNMNQYPVLGTVTVVYA